MRRVEQALEADQSLDPRTKKALQDLVDALKTESATPPSPVGESLDVGGTQGKSRWEQVFDDLAIFGDFRFRYESSFALDDKPDRHRARLRLRLGANYQLLDDVLVGARLATGDREDPNSSHVTLGDGFDSLEFSLDRAFITYRPAWLEDAYITGGKFGHPFYANPIYSELVWDADVQPEGLATGCTIHGFGPMESVSLKAGGYLVEERSTASESFLPVGQATGQFSFFDNTSATVAVGYYWYTNVDTSSIVRDNVGNAVADTNGDGTPDDYISNFGVLNPIIGITYSGWKMPVILSGEYILNTEAQTSDDQGWVAGVSLGAARGKGDWRFYYQYQVVEQDAVFSAFAQDDFLFSTNHRSHLFGVNYQVMDKVGLHVWGLVSQRDKTSPGSMTDSDKHQWRVRADLNVGF